MESANKKRAGFITKQQKDLLVEFVNKHPALLSGKFSNSFTWKDSRALWEEAAIALNAVPGSVKSWEQWRKTWKDLQSRAKTKQSAFRKEQKRTGGGSRVPSPDLDPTEQAVLDTIPATSIEGHEVLESEVLFIDDENPEISHSTPTPRCTSASPEREYSVIQTVPVPSTSQKNNTYETPSISRKSAGKVLKNTIENAQKLGEIQAKHYTNLENIEERKAAALERLAAAKERENIIRDRKASAIEKIADALLSFISR